MPIDTLLVLVGVYDDVADAKADYELVGDLHTDAGLIDAYDAAVIERTDAGKTRIVKKHETPTRVGGVLGGGMGLATGLVDNKVCSINGVWSALRFVIRLRDR